MKVLVPEPHLAGFLTAVYHAYYTHKDAGKISSAPQAVTLLDEAIEVATDLRLACKVRKGIQRKAGVAAYTEIANAYLSCDDKKEEKIFNYLQLLFRYGRAVLTMYANPEVIAFRDVYNKVMHEVHRFTGFLRFQELASGVYYSYFGGDNDIIELLMPHFKTRLNTQKFILHDIKRGKLTYWDGAAIHLVPAPDTVNILLSDNEILFSSLWKQYHKNVAIDGRKNLKLQTRLVPKKYRWFMNEF
ncbi:MAG: TIGR03915 family putative DNA repair protein [Clostridia bacterium]|nr:TIGR03915 family putative DNA repair protein [Clostridia bacterium]